MAIDDAGLSGAPQPVMMGLPTNARIERLLVGEFGHHVLLVAEHLGELRV